MTFMMSQANDKNVTNSRNKPPKKMMAKPQDKTDLYKDTAMTKKAIAKKPQKMAANAPKKPMPKNITNKKTGMLNRPAMMSKAKYD